MRHCTSNSIPNTRKLRIVRRTQPRTTKRVVPSLGRPLRIQRRSAPASRPAVANNMVGTAYLTGTTRTASVLNHRLRNTDLILNVTAPIVAAAYPAAAMIRIPCNPRLWPNTKAYQESLGWQCYCPHSISVKWSPVVGTNTAGLVVGGSLTKDQQVDQSRLSSALMAVPGSASGPVWKQIMFKMDLSALTQPKYALNDITGRGVPVDMFITLPSTAVGLLEVMYDITCYGNCVAPTDVPIYDIVPRSITMPAALDVPNMPITNFTGLVAGNTYAAVWAGAPGLAVQPQFSVTPAGTGAADFLTSDFNSTCNYSIDGGFANFFMSEPGSSAVQSTYYLFNAPAENLVTYIWLSGKQS
jgi:hypothetical protein